MIKMPKRQPKRVDTADVKQKGFTIMEHIQNLTIKKVPWEEYSDLDIKSYFPFMIERWLSMDPTLTDIIAVFQE